MSLDDMNVLWEEAKVNKTGKKYKNNSIKRRIFRIYAEYANRKQMKRRYIDEQS